MGWVMLTPALDVLIPIRETHFSNDLKEKPNILRLQLKNWRYRSMRTRTPSASRFISDQTTKSWMGRWDSLKTIKHTDLDYAPKKFLQICAGGEPGKY